MADNSGQYIPNTFDYLRIKKGLHQTFQSAVGYAYQRFNRKGDSPVPLPTPQEGPSVLNPQRGRGPQFGNEAKRRFLF